MREENLRRLDEWLSAMSSSNYYAARPLMAENITLHLTGRNPFSGTYRGKDDVVDALRRIDAVTRGTDEFVEIVDKMASDDHAMVRARKRIKGGGKILEYTRTAFLTIEGGEFKEVWLVDDQQYEMDELLERATALAMT